LRIGFRVRVGDFRFPPDTRYIASSFEAVGERETLLVYRTRTGIISTESCTSSPSP